MSFSEVWTLCFGQSNAPFCVFLLLLAFEGEVRWPGSRLMGGPPQPANEGVPHLVHRGYPHWLTGRGTVAMSG